MMYAACCMLPAAFYSRNYLPMGGTAETCGMNFYFIFKIISVCVCVCIYAHLCVCECGHAHSEHMKVWRQPSVLVLAFHLTWDRCLCWFSSVAYSSDKLAMSFWESAFLPPILELGSYRYSLRYMSNCQCGFWGFELGSSHLFVSVGKYCWPQNCLHSPNSRFL